MKKKKEKERVIRNPFRQAVTEKKSKRKEVSFIEVEQVGRI